MLYRWKVRLLKTEPGVRAWRARRIRRGSDIGNYHRLPEYVNRYAVGKSFADIGCMWGVNGAYSFMAEEAGATSIKAVDVFGPTPEFDQEVATRDSNVEFILGDVIEPATIERVGEVETVLCAGVLYHHPSPFDLLSALRMICTETLILRTSTIPEMKGLPNVGVFYPHLDREAAGLWNLDALGVSGQLGIATEFRPEEGYGNWFWGFTPSCLASLATAAGFKVVERYPEPFAQTFICKPVLTPFRHRLPDSRKAKEMGTAVSDSGRASPA